MRIAFIGSSLLAAVLWLAVLAVPLIDCGEKSTQIKLAKAVAIAEQLGNAEAVKAKFHDKKEPPQFEIELLGRDGGKIKITLDSAGKKLENKDKEPPKKESSVEGKIKLSEAISIAERLGGGQVLKADWHSKGEHAEFHIEVLTTDEGKLHIHLDPRGKRVNKDEPAPKKAPDKKTPSA